MVNKCGSYKEVKILNNKYFMLALPIGEGAYILYEHNFCENAEGYITKL